MDNRINQIRRKISVLRAQMLDVETAMHDQIKHDLDCGDTSTRLMAQRAELAVLVRERKSLGDLTPIGRSEIRKARRR